MQGYEYSKACFELPLGWATTWHTQFLRTLNFETLVNFQPKWQQWLYTNILSILNLVSPHTAASYCVANLFMLQECTVVCSIINQKGVREYWNIYHIVFKFVCFINVSNFHEAPFLRFKMTQSGIWGAHHITTSYELFFQFSVFWPLFGAVFMKATVSWSRSTTAIAFTQRQIYKEIRHFKFLQVRYYFWNYIYCLY